MATQGSSSVDISGKLLVALLRARETQPRAALIAHAALEMFPGAAAVVYVVEDPDDPKWTSKAVAGEIHLDEQVIPFDFGTLGALAEDPEVSIFAGSKLNREDYAHLHARRTVQSLAYVPLLAEGTLIGALEIIAFESETTEEDLTPLIELAESSAAALAAALDYERERNSQLSSISRLAQLYDLEKVFNSTPEMDDLLPIVARKFREVLNAQAVNLWLVGGEGELLLLNRDGEDPTVEVGAVQRSGEGIVAEVSDSGEPLILSDSEDARLKKRNASVEDGAVFSLIAVPIVAQEKQVGIVEAINKPDGNPFDDDDLFLLTSVAETAANALHNASLLQAERKVEILETLVKVSTEITSTLNLERVLQAVVNTPGAVIPYERAALALEQRGKLQLRAVSGMAQINPGDPDVERLRDVLRWAAVAKNDVYVRQQDEENDANSEEARLKFRRYFAESGMRGFYALPLLDDEGTVGVISFESSDPDFLSEAHIEMIKVLAGQATVALRNASMYREVPFITLLEPILQKKQKFLALEKHRRTLFAALTAAIIVLLVVFPLPMRVDGNATVAAARSVQVQSEVDGVIRQVYVREGQHVQQGQILADLEDWEYRTALAGARAKLETASSEMNRALAGNDGTVAGIQRVQAAYWLSEVERGEERLEKTHLRAPWDGWVATSHVEDFTGRHLAAGDTFAQVVDSTQAMVDVAIDERDVALLRAGTLAAVKLDSFPLRTLKGRVAVVSPKSDVEGEQRVFYARVSLPNPDGSIRSGMQGRGKVSVGWHPVGYVMFRRPGMWIYTKLWSWFGW